MGASKTFLEPMVRSAQTMHLSYMKIHTVSKRTKTSFHLSLVTWEYHRMRPKRFSEHMERLAQTVHLSCTDTNAASKQTELRFHMTHVT